MLRSPFCKTAYPSSAHTFRVASQVLAHLTRPGSRPSYSLLAMRIDTGRRTSPLQKREQHVGLRLGLKNKDIRSVLRRHTLGILWPAVGSALFHRCSSSQNVAAPVVASVLCGFVRCESAELACPRRRPLCSGSNLWH